MQLILVIVFCFASRILAMTFGEDTKNSTYLCECNKINDSKKDDNLTSLIVLSIFLIILYTIIIVILTYTMKHLKKKFIKPNETSQV